MKTVRTLIDANATSFPNRIFLYTPEAQLELSWGHLKAEILNFTEKLARLRVGAHEKVAFLLDNGYWTTILFLGAMYGGRVILPLNAVAGHAQLEYILEHSEAKVLFISETYANQFSSLVAQFSKKLTILSTDEDSGPTWPLDATPANAPQTLPPVQPDDAALLIYTSGTTGLPKGALLTHKNVIAGGANTAGVHQLTSEDRALCVLPLYHINGEMVTVMSPLVSGSSVVMPHRFSISQFWQWIAQYQCTWFSAVPTIFSYLLDHQARAAQPLDFSTIRKHLKFGRSASSALPPATHKAFEERFHIPIIETMGLTETAAQILSNPMPPGKIKYGSAGQPYGNEAIVFNATGNEAEIGEVGEIAVRGDNVLKEYYKNPQATQAAIDAQGWFHTGDLGYRDEEGFFFITGRLKELIIKGGENIAPQEIDNVLYKHPAVLEAAAFGIADENYGQEVMACVVLKAATACSAQALKQFCTEKLGRYKAPKKIHIMHTLPKGPSGKIQRLKLAEKLAWSKKTN